MESMVRSQTQDKEVLDESKTIVFHGRQSPPPLEQRKFASALRQLRGKYQRLEEKYRKLKDRNKELEKELSRALVQLKNNDKTSNKLEAVSPARGNPLFETAWEFYKSNREDLVKKYCDKYVVISGNSVIDAYEDHDTAYYETQKTVPLGSFLIHHVTEEEEVFQLSPFIGI